MAFYHNRPLLGYCPNMAESGFAPPLCYKRLVLITTMSLCFSTPHSKVDFLGGSVYNTVLHSNHTKRRFNMNKNELVSAMVEKSELSKKDCEAALDAFTATIESALKAGDSVQLVGFGTFEVRDRAARTGRNPQTKETVEIPATRVPAFKAGKLLKEMVQ